MQYVIYIPENSKCDTQFMHYGTKGHSGAHPYGSGLYGFQDLRRSGVMDWSLQGRKGEGNGVESTGEKKVSSKSKVAAPKDASVEEKREAKVLKRLEAFRSSPELRDALRRDSETLKALKNTYAVPLLRFAIRAELRKIDKRVALDDKRRSHLQVDDKTGLLLKDPNHSDKLRDPITHDIDVEHADKHLLSILDDVTKVNPKRSDPTNKLITLPNGYTHNCGLCSIAYEMRRRGYDTRARDGISLPDQTRILMFHPKGSSGGDTYFNNLDSIRSHNLKDLYNRASNANVEIKSYMDKHYPEESRGFIGIGFFSPLGHITGAGHAANFERHGGKTYIIDGQTNEAFDIESKYAKEYFSLAFRVDGLRTDNVDFRGKEGVRNICE